MRFALEPPQDIVIATSGGENFPPRLNGKLKTRSTLDRALYVVISDHYLVFGPGTTLNPKAGTSGQKISWTIENVKEMTKYSVGVLFIEKQLRLA